VNKTLIDRAQLQIMHIQDSNVDGDDSVESYTSIYIYIYIYIYMRQST